MTTRAQTIANQRNAQRSTGPKTQKGKAIASKNSLKHGLTAAQTVIKSEDQAVFNLHRSQIFDELAPQTPIESMLAERFVELSWRLKRAGDIQNQTIDELAAPKTSTLTTLLAKYTTAPQTGPDAPDPELALGRLAIKDFSNNRVLEKLLMHERRIEGSFYKTLLELQRLKMIKKLKDAQDPALEL